jgi:hypothetical protein
VATHALGKLQKASCRMRRPRRGPIASLPLRAPDVQHLQSRLCVIRGMAYCRRRRDDRTVATAGAEVEVRAAMTMLKRFQGFLWALYRFSVKLNELTSLSVLLRIHRWIWRQR